MKFKKLICTLSCLLITLAFSFGNEKLDNDLAYLKRVLSEAYAGYEYNVEQGFDFDAAIENVRNLYLKKAEKSKIDPDTVSDKLLASCINTEIVQKLKVLDHHFAVMLPGRVYSLTRQVWLSSEVYFTKQGDDYFVSYSKDSKIKKNSKYTGDPEKLFRVIRDNQECYVFGTLAKKISRKQKYQ